MKPLALGACCLLLAACARRDAKDTDAVPLPPLSEIAPPAIGVASATLKVSLVPEGALSVSEVRSVHLTAMVSGIQGSQGIGLVFTTPDGDLYQQQVETVFGNPDGGQTVDFDLPVAGTHIDQGHLAGTWTARLVFGAQVLATQPFELKP